jgi:hypothetical protein
MGIEKGAARGPFVSSRRCESYSTSVVFAQEALAHDALAQEAELQDALDHEALAQEAELQDALDHEALDQEAAFQAGFDSTV